MAIFGNNTGANILNRGQSGLSAMLSSNQERSIIPANRNAVASASQASTTTGSNVGTAGGLGQTTEQSIQQAQTTAPTTVATTAPETSATTVTAAGGLPSFTPTEQQLSSIKPAENQRRNIAAGEVLKVGNQYVYVDPLTGIQMKTSNPQLAQYQATRDVTNFVAPELTPTQISGLQQAKNQGLQLGEGEVNYADGFYRYRDPATGLVMKTKDMMAAYTQANRDPTVNITEDTNLQDVITTADPSIGDWTQVANLPSNIDYSQFTYSDINNLGKNVSYADLLDEMYGGKGYLVSGSPNIANQLPPMQTYGYAATQQPQSPFEEYTPFTYSDANKQNAVDVLNKALDKALYTTQTSFQMGMGNPTATRVSRVLNTNRIDSDIAPFLKGKDAIEIGRSGISMLDALKDTEANKILEKVAAQTGMSVQDLRDAYQTYHYANQSFYNPNATNWGDLMASGAKEDVLSGVGEYTGYNKKIVFDADKTVQGLEEGKVIKDGKKFYFIDPATGQQRYTNDETRAKSLAEGRISGDTMLEIMNSQLGTEPVAKEFTGETDFQLTEQNPIREVKDASGNTYFAVLDADTGKTMIAKNKETADKLAAGDSGLRFNAATGTYLGNRDDALEAEFIALNKPSERGTFTNINTAMKWTDFLPSGVTISTATAKQIQDAKDAFNGQRDLMQTWIDPNTMVKDAGKIHTKNDLGITAESDPLKKGGNYFFVNDVTGDLVSVANQGLADWAANATANDTPFLYKDRYYYFDKETGDLKSASNYNAALGSSQYTDYLQANSWTDFLPANVTEKNATNEQKAAAITTYNNLQEMLKETTGEGSVFNLFKSLKLPIPEDFYYAPTDLTRTFNVLANTGVNPSGVSGGLSPQNVYKESLEYDEPDGGLGSFIASVAPIALSFVPGLQGIAPYLGAALAAAQGDTIGALTSLASGTGILDDLFKGATGSVMAKMTDTLQDSFGLSKAAADAVTKASLWGGATAIQAALNDQDILAALATGAGTGLLSSKIDATLAPTISNRALRSYIVSQLTNATVNAIKGNPVVIAGQVIT